MSGIGRHLARHVFLVCTLIFMAAPLVIIGGVSLNGQAEMRFPPRAPGLNWYFAFFADQGWRGAVQSSLIIALLASAVAVSIGLPISYAKWKFRSNFARGLEAVGLVAFMLPPVVVSVVFLVFWASLGRVGNVENIVVAHAVVFVALPLATIGLGFRSIDASLVEAAQTMGATDRQVFMTVVLPMILPYIMSGLVFVFIMSLNEYMIAYMVAGFSVETMPIKIFNSLRMGFQPSMCVGAMLFLIIGIVGFSSMARFGDLPRLLGGGFNVRTD